MGGWGGGEGDFKKPVNIAHEWKRHKWLILILNLKASKETRSEDSKNKAIIKRVSNINKLRKSK